MNIFKKLLIGFLHKEIKKIKREQYSSGYSRRHQQIEEQKENLRNAELSVMQDWIGQKVIYCSNEWEDPLFGTIVAITSFNNTSCPMYVIEDVFGDSPRYCFNGTLYYADEKMVDAILKLNPFERWNMNLARGYLETNMWSKSYPPSAPLTDPIVLKQKLKEAGFI
jgi:hypothetical protein